MTLPATRPMCLHCDTRPAEDGLLLCPGDRARLGELLAEIDRGHRRLDARPAADGRAGGRGRPGYGPRDVARLDVLVLTDRRAAAFDPDDPDRAAGLLRLLGWWADRAREDGVLPPRRRARTVTGEIDALTPVLGTLAGRWWVGELLAALEGAVRHLRHALGEGEPTIPLGACPDCGGQVRAKAWGGRARCTGCTALWEGESALRELGRRLGDAKMDAAALARYCGIAVSTVRVWAHRDGWEREQLGGRTLYALADARSSALARGRIVHA